MRETILHEIAHALAPRGAGHGPVWRALAQSIGCNGSRCYGSEVAQPKPKFRGTCPGCNRVIYRHRRTAIACGKCAPTYNAKFAFIWSHECARTTAPVPSPEPPNPSLSRPKLG